MVDNSLSSYGGTYGTEIALEICQAAKTRLKSNGIFQILTYSTADDHEILFVNKLADVFDREGYRIEVDLLEEEPIWRYKDQKLKVCKNPMPVKYMALDCEITYKSHPQPLNTDDWLAFADKLEQEGQHLLYYILVTVYKK